MSDETFEEVDMQPKTVAGGMVEEALHLGGQFVDPREVANELNENAHYDRLAEQQAWRDVIYAGGTAVSLDDLNRFE
jgi:hypothetical protein